MADALRPVPSTRLQLHPLLSRHLVICRPLQRVGGPQEVGPAIQRQEAVDHHLGRPAVSLAWLVGLLPVFCCRPLPPCMGTERPPSHPAGIHISRTAPYPPPEIAHRTLVLLDGEPVPLSAATSPAHSPLQGNSPAQSPFQGNSPAISPTHSPMARDHSPSARSPLSRCASGAGGGSPFARAPMALRLQLLRQEGAAGSGSSSLGHSSSRGVGTFRHMFATPRGDEQAQQGQQQR